MWRGQLASCARATPRSAIKNKLCKSPLARCSIDTSKAARSARLGNWRRQSAAAAATRSDSDCAARVDPAAAAAASRSRLPGAKGPLEGGGGGHSAVEGEGRARPFRVCARRKPSWQLALAALAALAALTALRVHRAHREHNAQLKATEAATATDTLETSCNFSIETSFREFANSQTQTQTQTNTNRRPPSRCEGAAQLPVGASFRFSSQSRARARPLARQRGASSPLPLNVRAREANWRPTLPAPPSRNYS